jgi:hypothetical protein
MTITTLTGQWTGAINLARPRAWNHLHHLEQIRIDGISYINGGAICWNWWKGAQKGCTEGFVVLDLGTEGNVGAEYRSYGWKAAV